MNICWCTALDATRKESSLRPQRDILVIPFSTCYGIARSGDSDNAAEYNSIGSNRPSKALLPPSQSSQEYIIMTLVWLEHRTYRHLTQLLKIYSCCYYYYYCYYCFSYGQDVLPFRNQLHWFICSETWNYLLKWQGEVCSFRRQHLQIAVLPCEVLPTSQALHYTHLWPLDCRS
jgi:hypothetical protein